MELKGAHPQVAGRDTGEHGARQRLLAVDGHSGSDHRQRPGGGHPQRVHGLADQVLAEHRPDCRQSVATTGERSTAGALEVEVAPVRELPHQQGPPVAQSRGVAAELVSRVRLRDRGGAGGDVGAGQQAEALTFPEVGRVDPQLVGQRLVEGEQARRRRLGRLPLHPEIGEIAGEGIGEPYAGPLLGSHTVNGTSPWRGGPAARSGPP